MPLSLVTAPAKEPIPPDLARKHCKGSDDESEQEIFDLLIAAARERAELVTQRALMTQTWDLVLDGFPSDSVIELPKPPVTAITYVKYYNPSGVLTTMTVSTDYLVQMPAGPRCKRARIALPLGGVWPATWDQMGAVIIRFVAGYGTNPDNVPSLLRAAMLMDVGALYVDRDNVLEEGSKVHRIYTSYRSYRCQAA